jgi:hypothetical protein
VRLLLPPSEAKRTGGQPSSSLGLGSGSGSGLGLGLGFESSPIAAHRREIAAALVDFCRDQPTAAAVALALPARSRAEDLLANQVVLDAPVRPALDRYAGTVYEGLDVASLTATGRRRALASVLIFSGLFGVLTADEAIPAYRLPVAAALPDVGNLTAYWRSALRTRLPELIGDELVVDMRSSDYSAMWRPTGSLRDQVVVVRVLSEQPGGRLAVISYPSKHGKGRLARALLSSRAATTSMTHIAQRWTDAGGRDAITRSSGQLDLVD